MRKINISSDKPIESPDEDLLYRDFFASRLANMLSERDANYNLSVALYGAPGSGKSSILNLVEIHLNKAIKETKKKNRAVIRFNPWLSTDITGIRRDYFSQIGGVIKASSSKSAEQLASEIDKYADALDSYYADGTQKKRPKSAGKSLTHTDLMTAKKGLSKKLDSSNYRIYVLIDDLDKLDEHSLRAFIRFIAAYADLPGIIYLLAFDDRYVANVLADGDTSSGQGALHKIAQIGFEVPRADDGHIADLFFDTLFEILEPCDISEVHKSEIINLFYSGMESRLGNLRNLKRFLNSLFLHLPIIAGEVNISNYIGLDFLRVFYPDLYFDIYKNRDYFVGPTDMGTAGMSADTAAIKIKALLLSTYGDTPPSVINICSRLFPRVSNAFEGEEYSSKLEINWIKEKRICTEHYFDKYFTFAAPVGKLSDKEFDAIITEVLSKKSTKPLIPLIENGTIRNYFDRLIWKSDEFDQETLITQAKAVFEIGDRTKIDNRGTPEAPNAHTADYTCWWLLKRLPKPVQLEILNEILNEKSSLQTVLKYIRDRILTTYTDDPGFAATDIDTLKANAIARITGAVEKKEIPDNPDLISILFTWRDLESIEAPTGFLNSCFLQPDTAVHALERFTTYSHITDPSRKYQTVVQPTFDFRALEVLVDIETVANHLIELTVDIENQDDIKIIEDFIRLYNDYSKATYDEPEQPAAPPIPLVEDEQSLIYKKPPPIPPEMLDT